jgi:hypothetical protein
MESAELRRERGALLGVVLILLGVIVAASAFAMWGLRTDTSAAGNDRLSRQLFDCAEEGLQFGKLYFATTARNQWNSFLATNVCGSLPCPPFPPTAPGPSAAYYPDGAPYTTQTKFTLGSGQLVLERKIGIVNNPESPLSPFSDTDQTIIVYSRCRETVSNQSRAVQALITVPISNNPCGYGAQAGGDCRNTGNFNR